MWHQWYPQSCQIPKAYITRFGNLVRNCDVYLGSRLPKTSFTMVNPAVFCRTPNGETRCTKLYSAEIVDAAFTKGRCQTSSIPKMYFHDHFAVLFILTCCPQRQVPTMPSEGSKHIWGQAAQGPDPNFTLPQSWNITIHNRHPSRWHRNCTKNHPQKRSVQHPTFPSLLADQVKTLQRNSHAGPTQLQGWKYRQLQIHGRRRSFEFASFLGERPSKIRCSLIRWVCPIPSKQQTSWVRMVKDWRPKRKHKYKNTSVAPNRKDTPENPRVLLGQFIFGICCWGCKWLQYCISKQRYSV